MKNILKYMILGLIALSTSCVGDLDVTPIDPTLTFGEEVYSDIDGYYQALAKLYAGYNVAGQKGDNNESDLSTITDGGMSSYLRNYWNFQTLPTEEAINAWNDGGLVPLQNGTWSAENTYVAGMYYRLFYMIALANEYLVQTTSGKVSDRGHGQYQDDITQMRAEARLVRAISYYHAIDLFGNVPIVDEDFSGQYPSPSDRVTLFNWIITELEDLMVDLPEAGAALYGRMDKGVAYMVLAKMYLNAEVFAGEENPVDGKASYDEVIAYTSLINAAYTLESNFRKLFLVDNDEAEGIIFGVPLERALTQGFSATQYVISSSTNGAFRDLSNVVSGADWGGNHASRSIYDWFQNRPAGDIRGMTASTQSADGIDSTVMLVINAGLDMDDPLDYTQGLNVFKFKNRSSDGVEPEASYFVDTDWPLFRLADSYLMYAEAFLRGGNGTETEALSLVNQVIARGYDGSTANNITSAELTLDFLLEERGRELYYEGYRRQDLIRFGKFLTGSFLWQWKGGVKDGTALEAHREVYPIPSSELSANPNAVQNDNY